VLKVASLKDDHGDVDFLLGTRVKLDYSLEGAKVGRWDQVFGDDQISNLNPGESEAFQLRLEAENSLNLIDLLVEYVSSDSSSTTTLQSDQVVVVHAPTDRLGQAIDDGSIDVIYRAQAMDALIKDEHLGLWRSKSYSGCRLLSLLLLRGAACLAVDDIEANWKRLISKFDDKEAQGIIRTSFAEFGAKVGLPKTVRKSLNEWAETPGNLASLPAWDEEVLSVKFIEALSAGADHHQATTDQLQTFLTVSDSNLSIPAFGEEEDRGSEFQRIMAYASTAQAIARGVDKAIQRFSIGCLEYVVALSVVEPLDPAPYHERLMHLLKSDDAFTNIVTNAETVDNLDPEGISTFWLGFWIPLEQKENFLALEWRSSSPCLSRSFDAYLDANSRIAKTDPALDPDELVRFSAARSKKAAPSQLRLLSTDDNPVIRATVARNASCPADVLNNLLYDNNPVVRMWVAYNSSTSLENLKHLLVDPEERVRNAVEHQLKRSRQN
jgi:hypothetical protein